MSPSYLRRLAVVSVVLLFFVTPATAALSLSVDSTYDGTDGESQAIQTTMTLSPSDSKMQNVSISIDSTDRSFLDEDSFEVTTPGTEGVNVTYEGNGKFTIQSLGVDDKVTIEFVTYPKTIKETSLDVAQIDISYIQNGQDLTEKRTVTADMSSSSHFALQGSQNWQLIAIVLGVLLLVAAGAAVWLGLKVRGSGGGNNTPGNDGNQTPGSTGSGGGGGSGTGKEGPGR